MSSVCALSFLTDVLASKLGEKDADQECGVRHRRSSTPISSKLVPLTFPALPLKSVVCTSSALKIAFLWTCKNTKHYLESYTSELQSALKCGEKLLVSACLIDCETQKRTILLKHDCHNHNRAWCLGWQWLNSASLKPHCCAHVLMLFMCSLAWRRKEEEEKEKKIWAGYCPFLIVNVQESENHPWHNTQIKF